MLDFFRATLEAFPDLRMEVENLLSEEDRTVTRVRVTRTHREGFMGISPTGASGDIQHIDIMRFGADGQVCEHWASRTCCR